MKRNEVASLSEPRCGSYAYFLQHYIQEWRKGKRYYKPCDCGHCFRRKLRSSLSIRTVPCEKYKPQLPPGPIPFHVKEQVSREKPKQEEKE